MFSVKQVGKTLVTARGHQGEYQTRAIYLGFRWHGGEPAPATRATQRPNMHAQTLTMHLSIPTAADGLKGRIFECSLADLNQVRPVPSTLARCPPNPTARGVFFSNGGRYGCGGWLPLSGVLLRARAN